MSARFASLRWDDWRMGRIRTPVPFWGTHAFQACTIDRSVTHPSTGRGIVSDRLIRLKLQAAEQFVERQLNADEKFAEVRVYSALTGSKRIS